MKKFFVLFFSFVLLATFVPVESYAAVDSAAALSEPSIAKGEPYYSASEPTDKALQSAILAVKEKITIPQEYSDFNYYFNDSDTYSIANWSLYWTNPNTGSKINVNCDADYHITYYNRYDYDPSKTGIAKYLKSELEATAEKFADKIAPETNGYLKLVSSEYTYIYSGDYAYTYQRIKNGVDFPDNSVTVNVNSYTGEVTMASINWLYDAAVPSSKTTLTADEATALIKGNMKMKLVYHSNNYYIYDKIAGSPSAEAFLTYEPSESYISVDANTGEIYKTRSEWVSDDNSKTAATGNAVSMDSSLGDTGSSVSLTEDEIKKIEELKGLITKAQAIKLVTDNKSLYMDNNLTEITASLNKTDDGKGEAAYVWNVTLRDPRKVTETDYYRGNAYAAVDAKTGKILSYYSSMKSNYDSQKQKWNSVNIKYDKDQSRAILEKFLDSQAKDRFKNSVLSSENDDYVAYYLKDQPVYGGYNYIYNRVNEKIEYPDNYLYGSVDGVTGKIYSYGSYWNDNVKFQSASGVITADQAMDYYLGKDNYGLKYEINQITTYSDKTGNYTVDNQIRLVYRADVTPSYISPFTGEQLNYDGTVYTKALPYVYKDITNTPENRNILLLADMNIGFKGENFLPNQSITVEEMKDVLTSIGYASIDFEGKNNLITKEELAQLFINWFGMEQISKLDIYATGYSDESSIDDKYVGAVALAKGLGIMTGDFYNKFNPKSNVTRFDAVNMIIKFIEAQQNRIY